MTLSDQERRVLAALEERFAREDPRLARRMQSGREPLWKAAVFALLIIAAVGGGLALIVVGVMHNFTALMALGVGVTASGPCLASVWLSRRGSRRRG